MSTVQASTEGRKPLTTAQLYSAAHPKMNGALCHKAIDCDVTPCHCLAIGTVRCGVKQMLFTIKAATEYTAGTGVNGYGKRAKISGFYVLRDTRRVRAFTGKDAEVKATDWAKFCNENLS